MSPGRRDKWKSKVLKTPTLSHGTRLFLVHTLAKDFPERCPCHGGYLLGTSTIANDAKTGHSCTLAGTRDR